MVENMSREWGRMVKALEMLIRAREKPNEWIDLLEDCIKSGGYKNVENFQI